MTFYSRREFLATAVGAGLAGCVSPSAPTRKIVDTHTHFYNPTRPQGVPWPNPEDKILYRRVLPSDYRGLPTPHPVAGTVVVEASPWIEDNQWILDLAAREPFIVGFVGNLPVGKEEFASNLKRFAANPLFRGIRIGAQKENDAILRDLRMLADHNLALDLLGGLEILAFANRLSSQIPHLRIVIDHLANVRIDGKAPPPEWVRAMELAAKRPNIYCKISALVEGTGKTDGSAPRDAQFYAPILDTMVSLFGPKRLIYASNWPVSERFAPLATVQGITEDYFISHSEESQEQIFWRTGQNAYRWQKRRTTL